MGTYKMHSVPCPYCIMPPYWGHGSLASRAVLTPIVLNQKCLQNDLLCRIRRPLCQFGVTLPLFENIFQVYFNKEGIASSLRFNDH